MKTTMYDKLTQENKDLRKEVREQKSVISKLESQLTDINRLKEHLQEFLGIYGDR